MNMVPVVTERLFPTTHTQLTNKRNWPHYESPRAISTKNFQYEPSLHYGLQLVLMFLIFKRLFVLCSR
jgi:hypothetical protein